MMPDDVDGSELLMERLSKDNFLEILNSLAYQDVEVLLPQLAAFTNTLNLEPFFKELGVKTAFEQPIGRSSANSGSIKERRGKSSRASGCGVSDSSTKDSSTKNSSTNGTSVRSGSVNGDSVNNTLTSRAFKSPAITLVSMKQNAYFSMSFVTINSVGSVGTKLGQFTS